MDAKLTSTDVTIITNLVSGDTVLVKMAQSQELLESTAGLAGGASYAPGATAYAEVDADDWVALQVHAAGIDVSGSGTVYFYFGMSVDGTNYDSTNRSNMVECPLYVDGSGERTVTYTVDVRGVSRLKWMDSYNAMSENVSGLSARLGHNRQ